MSSLSRVADVQNVVAGFSRRCFLFRVWTSFTTSCELGASPSHRPACGPTGRQPKHGAAQDRSQSQPPRLFIAPPEDKGYGHGFIAMTLTKCSAPSVQRPPTSLATRRAPGAWPNNSGYVRSFRRLTAMRAMPLRSAVLGHRKSDCPHRNEKCNCCGETGHMNLMCHSGSDVGSQRPCS